MRAIQITRFGGPEVLQLVELPVPQPGADEVLIEVRRAGVNYADTHQRENSYVAKMTLPLVPGIEVAGIRTDDGERVIALCGSGGYAEYVAVPAERTFPIPPDVSDDQALAVLVQGVTAFHVLRTSAALRPGEAVVVHAAAGGVGSLTVQLARQLGAGRVIATASSDAKRRLALELGADAAVDPAGPRLTERLLEANAGQPVDVVIEMAGGEVFDASLAALAPFGRLVICGIASGQPRQLGTQQLLRSSRTVAGFWLMHCLERPQMIATALADLLDRVARGELRVVVGGTYGLSEAVRAQRELQSRRTQGKLLLDPRR